MVELTAPSRRTVIVSISAVLGVVAISSLAYLYIRENNNNKRSLLSRRFRSLQKTLHGQLFKAQDTLDDLVENDLRLIQVRVKTLRTHRLYSSDQDVQLPSLGLINEQDQETLGDQIEETKEELIRERTLGFEDHAKVRQGYHQLEMLAQALQQQLGRLSERVSAVDVSELAELGEETVESGGKIVVVVGEEEMDEATKKKKKDDEKEKKDEQANGTALLAMDKVRKHRRSVLRHIHQVMTQLERIRASYQDRLRHVREYEMKERLGLEPSADDGVEPTIDHELMKQGMTFADVAAMNIEEPEILAPTEDLEKMKQGITFAQVAAEHLPPPSSSSSAPLSSGVHDETTTATATATTTTTTTATTEVLKPTEDLEKMKHGVTFADVVAHDLKEEEEETKGEEVLAPTEDLEKMKQGVTFADVVAHHLEEEKEEEEETKGAEVLAPTEDLELMKQGVSFAEMAKHNIETPSDETTHVLPAADDRKRARHGGGAFVDGVAEV
ncbi:MAG: hypothetical protein J3Q66DRAFT_384904 [Benniella sp.]|nr:MAG: hypothetical protein J3Q66DRAFT_384904 [Benniella sp.]